MFRHIRIVIALTIAGLICTSATAVAQDIKARMKARLPVIVELKQRGIVGENNQGYLEFLPGKKEKAEVVAEENADRRIVYDGIAKKTNTTAELVGKRRALQIAEKAEAGEWLQDQTGKWYQK